LSPVYYILYDCYKEKALRIVVIVMISSEGKTESGECSNVLLITFKLSDWFINNFRDMNQSLKFLYNWKHVRMRFWGCFAPKTHSYSHQSSTQSESKSMISLSIFAIKFFLSRSILKWKKLSL